MKVALCIRKDYNSLRGGDSTQLIKTKTYLDQLHNIKTEIITDPAALNGSFDLIHIFNLATRQETNVFFKKAISLKKKIALSTIFWDYTYQASKDFASLIGYNHFDVPGLVQFFVLLDKISAFLIRRPRIISSTFRNLIKDCVESADVLLPNSIEELQHLAAFARINYQALLSKTVVVVNGVDPPQGKDIDDFHNHYNLPPKYILQVGRIEYIKNQLGVLEALKNEEQLPIVFLGRPGSKAYFDTVKKKAEKRGNVYFINEVPHEDVHLFFKHALLHVLPSMRESPGLVNLEALLNQCPIVVSDSRFLPFDSYFKDIASAVNPLSPSSIRDGIFREMEIKRDMNLIREIVMEKFSWAKAAKQTYDGYLLALKSP
jgi:glycosyltransferase involved in cell wall biosynthesis